MRQVVLAVMVGFGCGNKSTSLPLGGAASSTDTGQPTERGDTDDPICADQWNHDEEGVATQPETCMAWSPLSMETMTWYEAANRAEGEAGGCSDDDCPSDADGYCDTLESLGGRSDWRLPTKDELMEAAKTAPEIPDVDGRLWTRDSANGATGNAWTVDLGRPGSSMSLSKDDDGIAVRCVSDS